MIDQLPNLSVTLADRNLDICVSAGPALTAIGRPANYYEGHNIAEVMSPERHYLIDLIRRGLDGHQCTIDVDYGSFTLEMTISPIRFESPDAISHVLIVSKDVTKDRMRAALQLSGKSLDTTTGLDTRGILKAHVADDIRYHRRFAVFFLDLDRFKQVNDVHGHAAGDHLLQQVGTTLRRVIRKGDIVARYGGDEFAMAMKGVTDPVSLAVRIRDDVELVTSPLGAGCSVGFAEHPVDGATLEDLLVVADRTMYASKRLRAIGPSR